MLASVDFDGAVGGRRLLQVSHGHPVSDSNTLTCTYSITLTIPSARRRLVDVSTLPVGRHAPVTAQVALNPHKGLNATLRTGAAGSPFEVLERSGGSRLATS